MIEGLIEFSDSFGIAPDCVGKTYPIKIAGYNGVLAMPRYKPEYLKSAGSKSHPWLIKPFKLKLKLPEGFFWGISSNPVFGGSSIRACALFFEVDDQKDADTIGATIYKVLLDWRMLLHLNISVVQKRDIRAKRKHAYIAPSAMEQIRLVNTTTNLPYCEYEYYEPIKLRDFPYVLGDKDIIQILNYTSDGVYPHIAYILLTDAEAALNKEDFRKTILDAATALEVCFTAKIEELLTLDDDMKKYVSKHIQALAKKGEFIQKFHGLPQKNDEYRRRLYEIINKAIHEGETVFKDDAIKAYKLVEEAISFLLPKKFMIAK